MSEPAERAVVDEDELSEVHSAPAEAAWEYREPKNIIDKEGRSTEWSGLSPCARPSGSRTSV